MKQLIGSILLLAILAVPGSSLAQQVGGTVPSSLLQTSGAGLQETPAGLQGSAPQIFGSSNGGILEQPNQKLSNAPSIPNKSGTRQETKEEKSAETSSKRSRILPAFLCLILAGAGMLLYLWLRTI